AVAACVPAPVTTAVATPIAAPIVVHARKTALGAEAAVAEHVAIAAWREGVVRLAAEGEFVAALLPAAAQAPRGSLPRGQAEHGQAHEGRGNEFSHGVMILLSSPRRYAPAILIMAGERPCSGSNLPAVPDR